MPVPGLIGAFAKVYTSLVFGEFYSHDRQLISL
jgi:hypothetical protein